MIAVAGATGRLGTRLVTRLARRGLDVRVLTRDPGRARHLTGLAAEVVTCDVRDSRATAAAVRGTETVVSAVQGFAGPGRVSPRSVDRDGNANLVDAAVAAGAAVVLVSVVGAAADHPMDLFRAKHAAEAHLRAAGAPWTIVRATAFVELWAELLRGGVVFGRGSNPINFVSVEDVAAAVERAVLEPSLRGTVIEVGGPENLTFDELAALVQAAGGGAKSVRHVPRALLRTLSPLSRRARAAVAMDTLDMTFDAAAHGACAGQPTDVRTALSEPVERVAA